MKRRKKRYEFLKLNREAILLIRFNSTSLTKSSNVYLTYPMIGELMEKVSAEDLRNFVNKLFDKIAKANTETNAKDFEL